MQGEEVGKGEGIGNFTIDLGGRLETHKTLANLP